MCYIRYMQPLWNDEKIDFLKSNYPNKGKMWCVKQLQMKEHQVRYKASKLKLRIDVNGEFHKLAVARGAATRTGRKRPEHSDLMKRYASANRILKNRQIVKKYVLCTNCSTSFSPTRVRGNANFRCCSEACAKERASKVWKRKPHPRGMLGKNHAIATRVNFSIQRRGKKLNLSDDQKQRRSDNSTRLMQKRMLTKGTMYSRSSAGWFDVGGQICFFRSSWEVNYARYLQWLLQRGEIQKWEYEPDTFWFESIRRGVRSYLPDFKVTEVSGVSYHEVKGWMDAKSKTKLDRMARYYPEVKLVLIEKNEYNSILKWESMFPDAISTNKCGTRDCVEVTISPV